MAVTITINGTDYRAQDDETILQLAKREGIPIPTLCHLEGLSVSGACRLCLVEVEHSHKLQPACALQASEGMSITTENPRLANYRKMILELLFAEGNHVCSVCVSNGNCELQDLAVEQGMDHVRYSYQSPKHEVDLSHQLFGFDANRCILCTRCVRTCDEIEGAHTWDVAGRGANTHLITDMAQPWGSSSSCTWCSKCVYSCPVGALFYKGKAVGEMRHRPGVVNFIQNARQENNWEQEGSGKTEEET